MLKSIHLIIKSHVHFVDEVFEKMMFFVEITAMSACHSEHISCEIIKTTETRDGIVVLPNSVFFIEIQKSLNYHGIMYFCMSD